MILNNKQWSNLSLVCLGIFAGTAFCMKWIEPGFKAGGETFTILGLEIFNTKEEVSAILSGLDNNVQSLLRYHLVFDFAFMAGVYPGIAAICMTGSNKAGNMATKKLLLFLAVMQLPALICDITENIFLLHWLRHPAAIRHFHIYHLIVMVKWVLALAGAAAGIFFLIMQRKSKATV